MAVTPGVKLKVDRKAMDKLFQSLVAVDRVTTEVGYFDPTPVPDTSLTVPALAAIQEYGTANIPARGFMRRGAQQGMPLLERVAAEEMAKVADGESQPVRAMAAIGDAAAGRILDTLENAASWATPNAPETIRRKGHDTPLLGTRGQLRSELQYAVMDRGREVLRERPRT
jgi:hypothetical protein